MLYRCRGATTHGFQLQLGLLALLLSIVCAYGNKAMIADDTTYLIGPADPVPVSREVR